MKQLHVKGLYAQNNNPNFFPVAADIEFTLCVKLDLLLLASPDNEFQSEERKTGHLSFLSLSLSLHHNNTISIYNFDC